MSKFYAAAALALVSLAGTAQAGPAYGSLKACLSHCISTTDPWTWARFWCGIDCVADYADSKLSLNVGYDPSSTGFEMHDGQAVLTWGDVPAAQVMFRVTQTQGHFPINRIEFRLMNQQHSPQSGGIVIGVAQGQNRIGGLFATTLINDPALVGQGGYLVAEIHYNGITDVDDVGVIIVQSGHRPCPADFDGDGTVDFFDYDAFVVAFEEGC